MEKQYNCIEIDVNADLGKAFPRLFGTNLEHTRGSVYGGLSAQMLRNRKFVGCPTAMEGMAQGWYLIGGRQTYAFFHGSYTHHNWDHYHMHRQNECNAQGVMNPTDGELCGIGQHEIPLTAGRSYDVAVVAKADTAVTLTAALTDRWGKRVYAKASWDLPAGGAWERYAAVLTPGIDDPDADIRITFDTAGAVEIGAVSLMDHNNFRGMRRDVVDCLKEMGIRVMRWPGGNFAGEYNWFDGLLPVDERAPLESYLHLETQPHSLGYDFHEINTDDFVALCREVGAEPYITINPVWNTAEESAAWVEYCNGDENTTYGKLRMERGFAEPYNVKLWSLGNEMGYGHMEGDKTPGGYAKLARKNAEAMLAVSPDLELCSSGPHPNGDWVENAVKPLSDIVPLVSLHQYISYGDPCYLYGQKDGLEALYTRLTGGVKEARGLAHQMRGLLGDAPTKISFDEWNIWHAWRRPSCVIDGVYTAGMLHMFMDEAVNSNLGVVCQFELTNESGIKVTPTDAFLSATGQAFAIMKPHQEGTILTASDELVATRKGDEITVTLINFSADEAKGYALDCGRGIIEATLYEGKSLAPHSYFEPSDLAVEDGKLEIPAHSVARIRYRM
jgi:alpha-N-arabinofuranosidase